MPSHLGPRIRNDDKTKVLQLVLVIMKTIVGGIYSVLSNMTSISMVSLPVAS